MYRPEEMAFLLEQARQYTDSQRLANEEKKNITWDGNTEGKISFPYSEIATMVRISEEKVVVTPETFESLKFMFNGNVLENEKITVRTEPEAGVTYITEIRADGTLANDVAMIISQEVTEDEITIPAGVYFLYLDENFYAKSLTVKIVNQIDQKYIPPIDRLVLNGTDGKQYALSVDSSGQLVVEEVTA